MNRLQLIQIGGLGIPTMRGDGIRYFSEMKFRSEDGSMMTLKQRYGTEAEVTEANSHYRIGEYYTVAMVAVGTEEQVQNDR